MPTLREKKLANLEKARAAKTGIITVISIEKQFSNARIDPDSPDGQQIASRYNEMPEMCRKNYLKAMKGKSMAAGKAKLSFATWNRLESGGPKPSATMSTMQAVADVLKCTVGDLT